MVRRADTSVITGSGTTVTVSGGRGAMATASGTGVAIGAATGVSTVGGVGGEQATATRAPRRRRLPS